jgi:hypothetical protein
MVADGEDELAVGAPAYDRRRQRYGVVAGRTPAGRVRLRAVGGEGVAWHARPEDVEPATGCAILAWAVARANARSRGEIL